MTREQYIDRVKKLQDLYDKECMIYDLGVCVNELTSPVVDEYMKMLAEATNDEPNEVYGTELAYFCFDRDFGEEPYYADAAKEYYVTDAGVLYDYLMSRKNN